MRRAILPLVVFYILSGAALSMAQEPAYKADDVVEKLLSDADSASRGLCLGVNGCEDKGRKLPGGFDMVVTFELNSDELTDHAKTNVAEFAKVINDEKLATAQFFVEGHTDATGSDKFNKLLSARRAESIVRYLASAEVKTDKLMAVGLGEADPRDGDPYNPSNRRVETRVEIN